MKLACMSPLPPVAPTVPFNSERFVRATVGNGRPQVFAGDVSWRSGTQHAVGTDRALDGSAQARWEPANRFHAVGTSYSDALQAAHRETLASTTADGKPFWAATGVLRARDGVYWITSLGNVGGLGSLRLDGPGMRAPITSIERTNDALQAIVGGATWIDFSGRSADFDPTVS